MTDHSWRDDAACLEQFTDMWFPLRGQFTDENEMARTICKSVCPVRAQCLADALEEPEQHGLRGGLTGQQRRRMKGLAA
jgi:WhiB family redox-sensing transcriptional regulator